MKKFTLIVSLIVAGITAVYANPVDLNTARAAAANFYKYQFGNASVNLSVAYIEKSSQGDAVYYVFNVDANKGFVIISAEDATHPVIGYSNEGGYVIPGKGGNADYWMQNRKQQILNIRGHNLKADETIKNEWSVCINNSFPNNNNHRIANVGPLTTTTWDQPSPYNAMCPGNSVTGCVATTMSQIMKYWSYPAHGISSSCYADMVSNGYKHNYGTLCAYYDTSHYVWSAMPNNVTSPNNEVAKLMYDAGVSVQMNYDPSESGSYVTIADNPFFCAQISFVSYFGYSKYIANEAYSNYTNSAWVTLIENELNASRVVEYAGADVSYGGHTWVCDGYRTSDNYLHMNWGWSGADNGYYTPTALNPGPYDFVNSEEILTNIQPPPAKALFYGAPTSGCAGMQVHFYDQSLSPAIGSPITSWQWTFQGGSPATSTLQNPVVTYNSVGGYDVTLVVTTNRGKDTLKQMSYIFVWGPNSVPFAENFESSFPPSHWAENNPNNYTNVWQDANVGGYGNSSHSMYFNNCNEISQDIGHRYQIYTQPYKFAANTKPKMWFDVAYAPYNATYSDSLAVYYSLDCGKTFTQVYLKGGMTLGTAGKTVQGGANAPGGCFLPLNTNWRTDTIDLSALSGQGSVMFSFEDRCGKGSDLYVDNINLNALPAAVYNLSEDNSLVIYPNPSNGNFEIKFEGQYDKAYDLSIYNVLGQQVAHTNLQGISGTFQYPVNLSNFGKGIYTVVLKNDTQLTVKKVAVF